MALVIHKHSVTVLIGRTVGVPLFGASELGPSTIGRVCRSHASLFTLITTVSLPVSDIIQPLSHLECFVVVIAKKEENED